MAEKQQYNLRTKVVEKNLYEKKKKEIEVLIIQRKTILYLKEY